MAPRARQTAGRVLQPPVERRDPAPDRQLHQVACDACRLPEWDDCYRFFRRWRSQGLLSIVHGRLRRACREQADRSPEPTAAIIDCQSLRAAEIVGRVARGYDGAKLLLAVMVTAANVQDGYGTMPLLTRMARLCVRIAKVWADSAHARALIDWAKQHVNTTVEIVKRSDSNSGFVLLPRRWVVERTLAWLVRHRRLARDYERCHGSYEELVRWAMNRLMTRHLGRAAARSASSARSRC